jgi:hypothetical protein
MGATGDTVTDVFALNTRAEHTSRNHNDDFACKPICLCHVPCLLYFLALGPRAVSLDFRSAVAHIAFRKILRQS